MQLPHPSRASSTTGCGWLSGLPVATIGVALVVNATQSDDFSDTSADDANLAATARYEGLAVYHRAETVGASGLFQDQVQGATTDRLEGLARHYAGLDPARAARAMRWEAAGVSAAYRELTKQQQASADRWQGIADTFDE